MQRALVAATATGILLGALALASGWPGAAELAWSLTTAVLLVPLTLAVARDLRRGRLGVDVIALLAMIAALALRQALAGAIVALMLSGGQALESFAAGRARRELDALLARAPRSVHRHEDGRLADRPIEEVEVGDRLLVKTGEIVPVDGRCAADAVAVLDESALTGEARPITRSGADAVRSGTLNAGAPFDLVATAVAAESTYAGIVRLVQQAQAQKAPFVRLADRWAAVFLPVTLGVAGLAWAASGEAIRALAVLVVATPCPLILAAPVALVAGLSRAAARGILVKGGGALEALARADRLLLDKTGTLTHGVPVVQAVHVRDGASPDDLLRLAAALDQVSPHVFAQALVAEAHARGLRLPLPSDVEERHGVGIRGRVGGREVALGARAWVLAASRPETIPTIDDRDGRSTVWVALDGRVAGAVRLEDPLRADAAGTVAALRALGFARILLVTGDRHDVAQALATATGVDEVVAECTPERKVEVVRGAARLGVVMMVGDGLNDAPALAAATVGVAMGARGATASAEAADVVITVDRFERVVDAVRIARRARGIALQSVVAGMGLSLAAMGVAAAGALSPVGGALLQEAIDVAVILNALRALRGGGT